MNANRILISAVLLVAACGGEEESYEEEANVIAELSSGARRSRAEVIRDVVNARGINNGALFGGIADAETGLAHCWSEATWACQGPFSSSCGGPVIAGAGDGPCSIRQGGLGMFQFDGGNFDQTLARDGHGILTVEGNVDHAVDFVIAMVIRSHYTPATDEGSALDFLNSIPIAPGDPNYEAWISTVTRYYNGCPQNGSCWASRRANYERLTRGIFHEMGGDEFWFSAPPPPPPPPPDCGVLGVDQGLTPDQGIHSCSGKYHFVHQGDGNVVLYNEESGEALWHTATHGGETNWLVMQGDGNFVLYGPDGAWWATGTDKNPGAWLVVQDDGNVVIYSAGGIPLWATDTVGR